MNHQDRRLLVQKYGLSQLEVSKVFSMVRGGHLSIDAAAKLVIKERSK